MSTAQSAYVAWRGASAHSLLVGWNDQWNTPVLRSFSIYFLFLLRLCLLRRSRSRETWTRRLFSSDPMEVSTSSSGKVSASGIITPSSTQSTNSNAPRSILVRKSSNGFGFNVRGQVFEGGQVKAIHGTLYGPLQHVSAVSSRGSAEKAGLCVGDKILEVYVSRCSVPVNQSDVCFSSLFCRNGVDVEGASHKQVVDLIKHSADELRLVGKRKQVLDEDSDQSVFAVVIASAGDETHSDIHSGEESSGSSNDYSERRSLAITIPDYSVLDVHDEKFYVSPPDCMWTMWK